MHVLHTQQRLQQFWLDTCRFDGRVLFEYGCRGAVVGLLAYQSSRWGLGEYGIDFNTVLLLSFGLLVGRSRRVTLSTLWVVVAVTLTMAVMFFWGWYREPRLQLLVVALGQIPVAIAVALRIPAFRTETIDPSGVG